MWRLPGPIGLPERKRTATGLSEGRLCGTHRRGWSVVERGSRGRGRQSLRRAEGLRNASRPPPRGYQTRDPQDDPRLGVFPYLLCTPPRARPQPFLPPHPTARPARASRACRSGPAGSTTRPPRSPPKGPPALPRSSPPNSGYGLRPALTLSLDLAVRVWAERLPGAILATVPPAPPNPCAHPAPAARSHPLVRLAAGWA